MTKAISALELTMMNRRFRKMERESALREYRAKKASAKPGQHPESRRSQELVKQIKSLTSKSVAQARQEAIEALTKSPTDTFADSVRDAAQRAASESGPDTAPTSKYVIFGGNGGDTFLMVVNEINGDTIFATTVNGSDGGKIEGAPMLRISATRMKKSYTLFSSLPDALAYAQMNGVKLKSH